MSVETDDSTDCHLDRDLLVGTARMVEFRNPYGVARGLHRRFENGRDPQFRRGRSAPSGTLRLNNSRRGLATPYFLTAAHCVIRRGRSSEEEARSVEAERSGGGPDLYKPVTAILPDFTTSVPRTSGDGGPRALLSTMAWRWTARETSIDTGRRIPTPAI